jgi:hypothetical protein
MRDIKIKNFKMNAYSKAWPDWWKQHHTEIGVVVSGLLLAIGYGFVLQLPFFFDDLPIMTWLSQHSLLDIWTHSSENSYYRPLAFTIYKLGLLLPLGLRQVVLHAVPLCVHWIGALLIFKLVKLCDNRPTQAVIAAVLFAVFPFMFLALAWITALSHPLVTTLALLAVYSALRAGRDNAPRWWGISLLATGLAPFAHESGPIIGLIVAGVFLIEHGLGSGRRHIIMLGVGILLNIGGVLVRSVIPGVGDVRLLQPSAWPNNGMFFLHGLIYPVGPVIGWMVNQRGWDDFGLVGGSTLLLGVLLLWLGRRDRDWRWGARNLWWWLCGAIPAGAALNYGDLFISPRLHTLSSAGVVMLWAGIIYRLGKISQKRWLRYAVWSLLSVAILAQNLVFLHHQGALFDTLNQVYRQVLQAAEDADNAPLGFVNVPAWLAHPARTYALVTEGVVFVPPYSNIGEFIQVNLDWRASDGVMFTPVLQDTEQVFGFHGAGLAWEEMRQFAIDHRTVWLTVYQENEFVLRSVGSIMTEALPSQKPLVEFEGGPAIESATWTKIRKGEWSVTLTWLAAGPTDGEIFVHVWDAQGNLAAQADGPALGGMVPIWMWQAGDLVRDERTIRLPEDGAPYIVQVGVYNTQGRYPAFVDGRRIPNDAATVATIVP